SSKGKYSDACDLGRRLALHGKWHCRDTDGHARQKCSPIDHRRMSSVNYPAAIVRCHRGPLALETASGRLKSTVQRERSTRTGSLGRRKAAIAQRLADDRVVKQLHSNRLAVLRIVERGIILSPARRQPGRASR